MSEPRIRNMEEFAAVSGISRPTVSKYFNDPESVRKSTRMRIEQALEQHEYRPNIYAINQNRRLTKSIGLVVPFLVDPFFAEIARNIENLIIATGYRPILLNSQGRSEHEVENLESLRSFRPAGVLIAPLGRESDRSALEAFCEDVPTVLFDSNISNIGHGFVGADNRQYARDIVEYLCRSGEPPCFFEMRTPANPNANKRRQSYLQTMEELGYEPHVISVEGTGWAFEDIGYRQGMAVIEKRLLQTNTVLCSNDRLAIGFLAACFEKGYRVGVGPQNALRVAGMDDHPFARFTCPPLTTVAQNYAAVSSSAVETLLTLLSLGDSEYPARREQLFEGRLVKRMSA
ncbi:LacI family DNA-binding transcriptional regulator [uncultured Roseobacter sp.]|uniref:LacI family DNA-binding transcriptional regulator n=1 Tax=uncultured Roseobacter sp. TaxID=114847 RepID=UPI00260751E5|nr:LacI family DNA-binding transcriptional regulator [uncultured Roseobacter sp.]